MRPAKPEPEPLTEVALVCFRRELLRGRPTEGTTELNVGLESEGDWEWEGVIEGACASVAIAARYWMTFLVLSVFPAPDSRLS